MKSMSVFTTLQAHANSLVRVGLLPDASLSGCHHDDHCCPAPMWSLHMRTCLPKHYRCDGSKELMIGMCVISAVRTLTYTIQVTCCLNFTTPCCAWHTPLYVTAHTRGRLLHWRSVCKYVVNILSSTFSFNWTLTAFLWENNTVNAFNTNLLIYFCKIWLVNSVKATFMVY